MHLFINKKKLIVSVIIAAVALIGDKNIENEKNALVIAVCDNVTHGLIGVFTWIGIFVSKTTNTDLYFVMEFLICGLFSSLVDVDHFIVAKSINLKEATSLKNRPFMHCTTLTVFIVLMFLSVSYFFKLSWLFKFGWILAAAFFSHNIRDSKRRGFWLWPFGSTSPTPNWLYIMMQMLLPHILSFAIYKLTPQAFHINSRINVELV